MPNKVVYFYCETALQLRIATAIAKQLTPEISTTLMLGEWTSGKNVLTPSAVTNVNTVKLDIDDGGKAIGPKERWRRISTTINRAVTKEDLFVLFQDQHFNAQAVVAGARAKNAPIILVQDGYLDFDLSIIPPLRRVLWPLFRRLDAKGPQHPRPRLRKWLYRYFYKQHFFGHTRPDHTFVFGASLARRLENQFGLSPQSVHPIGAPLQKSSSKEQLKPLHEKGKVNILFLDQCFLRYQRISKNGWHKEYLPVIGALAPYSPIIKLHPAQTNREELDIRGRLKYATFLPRRALQTDDLNRIDLAITATSSSFLECVAAGVPVVFVTLPSSLDRMPKIQSSLIRNVSTIEELKYVIEVRRSTGNFASNEDGHPLEYFIESYHAAPKIADFLKNILTPVNKAEMQCLRTASQR